MPAAEQRDPPPPYLTRLAPSPTGALHLGNARTFLATWLRARSLNGRIVLRMEDLDHPRVKPWAAQQAYDDLAWLGLDWDEGPPEAKAAQVGQNRASTTSYVQSERTELYDAAFDRLRAAGRIYPCTCTRADIEAAQSAPHEGEDLVYPGTCHERYASADAARADCGRAPAWRFRMPRKLSFFLDGFCGMQRAALWEMGDFVVMKGGGEASYQLAVVVDDTAMGVTEVIRADDLLSSTHRQLALQTALGLPPPGVLHLPLVVGPDGRRLAKRHGDTRISHLRKAGLTPERVVGWLAHTCGWAEEGEELAARDLLPRFDLNAIPREPVVLTPEQLRAWGVA